MRNLSRALLLLLVGLAVCYALFQRREPSLRWHVTIDRDEAKRIASEALGRSGVDLTGARPYVDMEEHRNEQRFMKSLHDPSGQVSPLSFFVGYADDSGEVVAGVRMDWRGRVRTMFAREKLARRNGGSQTPEQWVRAIAEVMQVDRATLQRHSSDRVDAKRATYSWPLPADTVPPVTRRFDVSVSDRGLLYAQLDVKIPGPENEERTPLRRLLRFLALTFRGVVGLAVLGFVIQALLRRQLKVRPVLVALLFILSTQVAAILVDAPLSRTTFESEETSSTAANPGAAVMNRPGTLRVLIMIGISFFALLLTLFVAVGLGWSRSLPDKLFSLELLLGRGFGTKLVGQVVLWAFALAPWPYVLQQGVVELMRPFVTGEPAVAGTGLMNRLPLLTALNGAVDGVLLVAFVFVFPLVTLYVPRVARLLLILTTWIAFVARYDRYEPLVVAAAIALALTLFYDFVVRRFDVATVIVTGFFSALLFPGNLFLFPEHGPMQRSAVVLVLASAAFLAYGTWSALRGEDVEIPASVRQAPPSRMERERLHAELSVARRLHERMLPPGPPLLDGFDIAGVCRPARQVGGDLYDFVPLARNQWGIAVADVCGKGVGAALFMTLTKGLLRGASEDRTDPRAIAIEMNSALHGLGNRDLFVTMALAVLSEGSSRVTIARAGHNPPLLWRRLRRESQWIQPPGVALGLARNAMFSQVLRTEEVELGEGDVLVLYSDGVTEAMSATSEEYGEDRLRTAVEISGGQSAEAVRDAILADLDLFVGQTPPSDDLTLVVVVARSSAVLSADDRPLLPDE